MSYNTPTSAPSSAYSHSHSRGNTTPAPGLGPVQTIDISAANSSGGPKPVVIQLAPPPPPRMRRKRLDALSVSGAGSNDGSQSNSSPTRSNEEQQASMSYMAHDVSYTYPYSHGHSNSTQENGQQSYQHEQQQQNQYQPYAQPPVPKRGPVVLTYVPPKKYGETQSSLLEVTETEGEADVNGHDLYLEDLGDEMAKALSRSSSMATTMSGLSIGGRTKRRTSTRKSKAIHQVVASKPNPNKPKPKSKRKEEDPATYIRKRGSVPIASRPKRLFGWEFAWDPLPSGAAGQAKERERERERELKEAEVQESSFMDLRGATTTVTSTATKRKLKRYSTPGGPMAAGKSPLSRDAAKLEKLEDIFGLTSVDSATTAGGAKKLKKRSKSASRPNSTDNTMPVPQPFPAQLSHSTGLPMAVAGSPPASGSGSGSGSGSAGPSAGSFNLGRGFGIGHRTMKSSSSSGKTSRPGTAESKNSYNQGMHGNGSKVSLGSVSSMRRGGLQLKKSFKMGVGRTLGPGLTLASASVGGGVGFGRDERIEKVRAWEKRLEEETEETEARRSDEQDGGASIYAPTMDDDDVDGEIRSLAAARLVSASIARATPAATILTAPSSAGVTTPPPSAFPAKFHTSPVTITYPVLSSSSNSNSNSGTRPTLPAIITSPIPIPVPDSPVKSAQHPFSAPGLPTARTHLSPTSTNQPHTSGSTWKPHPFADPVESPARTTRTWPAPMEQGSLSSSPEDDVVQLEREMEEIRSRGKGLDGQDALDSPSAPFKELAAFAGVPITPVSASASSGVSIPAPSISASMSPSVTSMFALAQAQAQTVAPPPLPMLITQDLASQKAKGKISAEHQKRPPLSAPPAPTSNWGPQHSPVGNGGNSTGGFPYKFPMIFPHSFTGVSPPRSSAYMNQPPQQSNSTPGTPSKGQSTLRLSAMTMGTVRNAFAGVGARMSNATMRMSVNGNGVVGSGMGKLGSGNAFGEMIMEDGDGDFMDLRDPFASPPPASKITTSLGNAGDNVLMIDAASGRRTEGGNVAGGGTGGAGVRRRMSTWGKLPMPARSFSPVPSAGSSTTAGSKKNLNAVARAVRIVGKPSAHRKHKKRSRKSATLPSMTTALGAMNMKEDADFGIEEALLSQRLLSRLDNDGWESRA
ncbi:hypothetical protein GALMADRAFT_248792 [Galerina marginata CBS 339.88]|uniref:Uncharacterized protein n=1 Tax=Galerina marginata (strain CBS 339.88) TaxID=685588 RepID=A0A067SY71_GALM3|nr:hypothetical protein GALMADRAFT_248792 [Galerina marginata CBS 339.88]